MIKEFIESSRKYNRIYLYGAGEYGRCALSILSRYGLKSKIKGFLVSHNNESCFVDEIPVFTVTMCGFTDEDLIIISVGKEYENEIKESIKKTDISNILCMSEFFNSEFLDEKYEDYMSLDVMSFKNMIIDYNRGNHDLYGMRDCEAVINSGYKSDIEICFLVGIFLARMIRIIKSLKNKGMSIAIIQYRFVGYPDYVGEQEARELGIKIYRCYTIEEALAYAMEMRSSVYYIESPRGDASIAALMIRHKQLFGKMVFSTYDNYIGTYKIMNSRFFESEKYALENADVVVWRYYSKDYISRVFGLKYKGKSIRFPDCCDELKIVQRPKKRSGLNICFLPSHVEQLLSGDDEVFVREARLDEIIKAFNNCDSLNIDIYIWDATNEQKNKLNAIIENENCGFVNLFYHIPHHDLMNRLCRYDYGIFLLTHGKIPSWPETTKSGRSEGDYRYAMSTKFFEYLSAGVPIISTNGVCQCDELEKAGALIKMDIKTLNTDYLIEHKNEYRANAISAREKYLITNRIDELIEMITS